MFVSMVEAGNHAIDQKAAEQGIPAKEGSAPAKEARA
jgi:hypothetical protein